MTIEIIVCAVGLVLLVLGLLLRKKLNENKALEALWIGIQHAYDEYVNFIKQAKEDGVLSPEEVKQAKDLAISKALEVAKGPVKDILLAWGKPKLEALITSLVQKNKEQ